MKRMARFSSLNRWLRTTLIATGLLVILQGIQIAALAERAHPAKNGYSSTGFLFVMVTLFLIPTSLILTGAVMTVTWPKRNEDAHRAVWLLGVINVLLAISLTIYALSPCGWGSLLGLKVAAC